MTRTGEVLGFFGYLLLLFNYERIERWCRAVRERMRHQ